MHRKCPHCENMSVDGYAIFMSSIAHKRIVCDVCGSRLKVRSKLLPAIVGDVAAQVIISIGILAAIVNQSWVIASMTIVLAIAIASISAIYGTLSLVSKGIK